MPMVSLFFVISGLASLGLPGFSGFVSEIMIFLGSYKVFPAYTIVSAFGVVLAAGYILWMVQSSFRFSWLPFLFAHCACWICGVR